MSLKILLADDSMTAQNMGKKILTDGGYDVVTVSNGAAAIKKLAEFTPDLIIADVYMPGYNGLEICERVKKAPATASVPVLLAVGKLEPFRPEEGLKVHADGVIIKPFEATDLLAVTAKLAERVGKAVIAAKEAAEAAAIAAERAETPEQVTETPVGADAAAHAKELSETPAFAMEETPAVAAIAADEFVVPTPAAVPAMAADEFVVPTPSVAVSSFAMEEPAAEHTFDLEEAGAHSSFNLGDSKPDYVREFGLDPHDAPTTMFPVPADNNEVPEPSLAAHVPEFDGPQFDNAQVDVAHVPDFGGPQFDNAHAQQFDAPQFDVAQADAPQFDVPQLHVPSDELVAQAPASLNFVVNEMPFVQKPSIQPEPVEDEAALEAEPVAEIPAETPEDDFEAKLAKAMAEYESTAVAEVQAEAAAEPQPAEAEVVGTEAEPVMALTVAAPTWVAEEVPVSSTEIGLSLESELRTFSAAAGASVARSPVHSFAPIAPIGETSFDDEVATMVEESKENFFASTFTDRVTAMVDQAGCGPAEEMSATAELDTLTITRSDEPAIAAPVMPVIDAHPSGGVEAAALPEWSASEEPELAMEVQAAEPSIFAPSAAPDLESLIDEDVPELLTHDVPTDWLVAAPAEERAHTASEMFEPAGDVAPEMKANVSDDSVLSHHDFVSHEAPFAHAAVDEVAIEHLAAPSAMSDAVASTLAARQGDIVQQVAEATPSMATFDHATVADVVERVMDRMKGEIVSQIARELAAKMGK